LHTKIEEAAQMPWLGTVTVVGLILLAGLIMLFLRVRRQDLIEELIAKRRPSARVCSRADLLDGMTRIPVALALTDDAIYYENTDLQASLELQRIEEVEYDDETSTGHAVAGKALRLRAHGHMFEFALELPIARQWEAALPARTFSEARAV
jgi:hypothetical protein